MRDGGCEAESSLRRGPGLLYGAALFFIESGFRYRNSILTHGELLSRSTARDGKAGRAKAADRCLEDGADRTADTQEQPIE